MATCVLHAWEYKAAVGYGTTQKSGPGPPFPLNKPHLRWLEGGAQPYGPKPEGAVREVLEPGRWGRGRVAVSTCARVDWHHNIHLCPPFLGGVQAEIDTAAESGKPHILQEKAQAK